MFSCPLPLFANAKYTLPAKFTNLLACLLSKSSSHANLILKLSVLKLRKLSYKALEHNLERGFSKILKIWRTTKQSFCLHIYNSNGYVLVQVSNIKSKFWLNIDKLPFNYTWQNLILATFIKRWNCNCWIQLFV